MTGVDKFTSVIESFYQWKNIPNMPNDGISLLHSRLRYALKKIGEDFRLQGFTVKTNDNSHLCGLTIGEADFFNIMVVPGRMYNRILINRSVRKIPLNNVAPLLSCSFESFLKNPDVLDFTISDIIGMEVKKMFARKHFP